MEGVEHRARKHLQVERGWESSRLAGQVIAAAYELVAPPIRRTLSSSAGAGKQRRQTTQKARQAARRHA